VLGATPENITLHCKSKDDDLAFHTLEFLRNYMFSFKPTLIPWQTTLFFCSFAWLGSPTFIISTFTNINEMIAKLAIGKYMKT